MWSLALLAYAGGCKNEIVHKLFCINYATPDAYSLKKYLSNIE